MERNVDLKKLFTETKTIAIVGLSEKPDRTSNRIARYLKNEGGYTIIPVNPQIDEVLGEKSYTSLLNIPSDIKIDIVNVFRRSEYLAEIAEQAVKINAGFFWAQLGIYDKNAEKILEKAGIPYIMDACIFVEHRGIFL